MAYLPSGFGMVPTEAYNDKLMTPSLRDVLGCIAAFCNRSHNRWGYVEQGIIAEMLGCRRETVNRSVKRLAELGYIESERQFAQSGAKMKNKYRVLYNIDLPYERYRLAPDTFEDEARPSVTVEAEGGETTPPHVTQLNHMHVTQLDHNHVIKLDHMHVTQLDHILKRNMENLSENPKERLPESSPLEIDGPEPEPLARPEPPAGAPPLLRRLPPRQAQPEPDLPRLRNGMRPFWTRNAYGELVQNWPVAEQWARTRPGRRRMEELGYAPPFRMADLHRVYEDEYEAARRREELTAARG